MQEIRPVVVCAVGFSMSVQASSFHYCSPRMDNAPMYSSVGIGFPSEREELLMPYAEEAHRPCDTVYARVPVDVVLTVVWKHGGCDRQLDWLFS